jgi:hypothetical protein
MRALFILVGIATIYAAPYVGRPLYCDRGGWVHPDGTLLYTLHSSKSTPSPAQRGREGVGAWVALDVRLFQTGQARCGDHVVLLFPPFTGGQERGQTLHALALDAGPFAGYYIADYPDLPIIVDVPAHLAPFAGLSSPVRVLNLSALDRAMDATHAHILPGD